MQTATPLPRASASRPVVRTVWLDTLGTVLAGDINTPAGQELTLADLTVADHFDPDHIKGLRAQVARDGRIIKPIDIHCHPNGTLILRDGHHRYLVARLLDLDLIPVTYHHGYTTTDGDIDYPTDPQW